MILVSPIESKRHVRSDRRLLLRVLDSLLDNARKYSPEQSVVRLSVTFDDGASFHVDDEGTGLSEEDRESVFQPFYRGSGAASTSGSGLGLVLAQRLAARLGGEVQLTGRPGGGTRATLRLDEET